MRTPFKIFDTIITWILVLVIHKRQIVGVRDEGFSDKSMYSIALHLAVALDV